MHMSCATLSIHQYKARSAEYICREDHCAGAGTKRGIIERSTAAPSTERKRIRTDIYIRQTGVSAGRPGLAQADRG